MDSRMRVNVRTSDAIDNWLYATEKAANRAGIRFRGKKMSKEGLVNALLASLIGTDPEKVIDQVRAGLALYEHQLTTEAPQPPLTKVS